ncbi:MAG: [FeFe] hydrogenase H-cluster radical SAM maturase HydE, partial [Endomicrobiales bacterium]
MKDKAEVRSLLEKVYESPGPEVSDLAALLSLEDPAHTQALYDFADSVRRESLGDGIVLRGIVEFSSFCRNTCHYCGLNRNNTRLK